jgi:two-component system phosphate regulon response regulator PhoB
MSILAYETPEGLYGKRVTLVDDDADTIAIARELSTQNGFDLVLAEGLLELMRGSKARPPDLVLMSLQLPIVDGLKTLCYFRNAYPDIPVVTLVENGLRHTALLTVKAGATCALFKPVDPRQLKRVIYAESS